MLNNIFRKTITHPALAIGSTVLWGMVELIALQRAAGMRRGRGPHSVAGKRLLDVTADRHSR